MELMLFGIKVIIAVGLGIYLYRDARGRDFGWGFWTILPGLIPFMPTIELGLFMPILIVVIYSVLRPKGKMLTCPHCSKKIHEILFCCPFCRKNAKHECLNCHEPVLWNAEQCPYCKSRAITKS